MDRKGRVAHALLQRLTLVERHDDEHAAVIGLVDFMDRADVRMVQRRCCFGFTHETLAAFVLHFVVVVCWEELDGHEALELQVARLVHDTHSTGADVVDDLVVGNGLSDHLRQPFSNTSGSRS